MSANAIEVRNLRMRCGAVEAVRGIDLDVATGEVPVLGVDPAPRTHEWVPQGAGA